MTHCADFEDRVDRIAMGDLPLTADDVAHLESCAACRGVLQRARALDAMLMARPLVEPPAAFTSRVLDGVRRERWHAEQVLDLGFNVAIAGGLLLILTGIGALAWQSGLLAVGSDLASLITAGMTVIADRATSQLPNVVVAMALLTMAIGVWWWAEGIEV